MAVDSPDSATWKALYQAAGRFFALKPWDWMLDSDVFGIRNPADGEVSYCCIMGAAGEHFALAVYLGSEGLQTLKRLGLGDAPTEPMDVLLMQKCLMASFENRDLLEREDLETIRTLGLKFRGRSTWPQFRSYRPGFVPWFLTQSEAEFLTLALDQTCDFSVECRGRPEVLATQNAVYNYERFLVRSLTKRDGALAWESTLETPKPYVSNLVLPAPPDTARIQAVAANAQRTTGIIDMDVFYMPSAVKDKDDERPWYPRVILCVDGRSGLVLHFDLAGRNAQRTVLADAFLTLVEGSNALPAMVQVCSEQAEILLEPTLAALEIDINVVELLPLVEDARASLYASL